MALRRVAAVRFAVVQQRPSRSGAKLSSVTGKGEERREVLELAGEREDVRAGRRFLNRTLVGVGWEDRLDDASLLLSELLANVALHARTSCAVVVNSSSDHLRIDVEDRSPVLPRVQHFSIDTTTGRGLRLVEKLADSWGVEPIEGGKAVWFSLVHESPDPIRFEGLGDVAVVGFAEPAEPDLDALLERLGERDGDDPASLVRRLEPVS
jgi:anti-sigma regulatory factor (Ser/Thr protein kinase)